jgi:hypothetical protein
MTELDYTWIPTKSVGQIKFGSPVESYVQDGLISQAKDVLDLGQYWSDADDTVLVDVDDNGNVESVLLNRNCIYKGENLIGMTLDEVSALLKATPDGVAEPIALGDGELETPAYFEAFGLTLGLRDGVVWTVDVDDGNYDD